MSAAHLIHLVPLRVQVLLDNFALVNVRPDSDHSVRVRLALDQPSQDLVLTQQVLGLDEVDS